MKRFEPHQIAWLSAHPHRTKQWLRDRLRDGFDVHHLDGNHGNNDPANLVLIEHTDHMLMHTDKRLMGRLKRQFPELGIDTDRVPKLPKPKRKSRIRALKAEIVALRSTTKEREDDLRRREACVIEREAAELREIILSSPIRVPPIKPKPKPTKMGQIPKTAVAISKPIRVQTPVWRDGVRSYDDEVIRPDVIVVSQKSH